MLLLTRDEMRRLDAAAQDLGIPGQILMENAGRVLADEATRMLMRRREACGGRTGPGSVVILCGPGRNGGDGLAAARHLAARGFEVTVALFGLRSSLPPEAAQCRKMLEAFPVRCFELDAATPEEILERLPVPDLVIDALLGTGSSGDPRPPVSDAIRWANSLDRPVLACDIPSGLDSDTGVPGNPTIRAATTVTMGFAKPGLVTYPGRKFAGELVVADLGFPPSLVCGGCPGRTSETMEAAALLPRREPDHHKGLSGHVSVVAGSVGMVGAACLAAMSALRAGAGTVTLVVPGGAYVPAAAMLKEVMVVPAGDASSFDVSSVSLCRREIRKSDAVVLGPGWGRGQAQVLFLKEILEDLTNLPCVIDADAIVALKEIGPDGAAPERGSPGWVLTPHPGEMAKLMDVTVPEVQSSRLKWAREAARTWRAVVVLKGAGTITAEPSGKYVINTSGHPAMATAGSGDVLAGMIGALLAQGLNSFDAAWVGAYWHGLAGEICGARTGAVGVVSGDIANAISRARRRIEERR